ncbi:hypothetical protein P3T20_006619 [Paraburkholderia sp. GAS206C]|uniref:MmgE/PrpD family protein n=1 Tax=unclassified Paraburkholderia TaxID=2615204 RepID=UPI003D20E318
MHETATHSPVSDALVGFATASLTNAAAPALAAAQRALEQARAATRGALASEAQIAALQGSQPSPQDARTRAWAYGAALARVSAPSVATPVLAAVLAFGERGGASDDVLATAAAIGVEAAQRVLTALDDDAYRARWNVASSIGVLGATLAITRLLALDAVCTRNALGVAATQAAGLARNANGAMEALETGKAAADAIEAALLAKHGFTSALASIDGRRGLAALMAYRFDAAAIIDELGTRWISAT